MAQTISDSTYEIFLMNFLIYCEFEIAFELLCSMMEKFVKKFNELNWVNIFVKKALWGKSHL